MRGRAASHLLSIKSATTHHQPNSARFISPRRRYAAIVFLDWVRFETHKRKLSHLTFNDFFVCADALLRHWADEECELDKEFFQDLREIKAVLEREKEAKM